MGSSERSKKKVQLWKKAMVHFSLCFIMGFFTGFAPTGKSTVFSSSSQEGTMLVSEKPGVPENKNGTLVLGIPAVKSTFVEVSGGDDEGDDSETEEPEVMTPMRLLIVITPLPTAAESQERRRGIIMLEKMANTMRLVPPPVLWVVVEKRTERDEVSEMLRRTGIMYRHVVYKENFTDAATEADHQRNVALRHVKEHSLSGIVHFAPISNVYDLNFFNELREIKVFGTWPVAVVSASEEKVDIKGPVCDSSQLLGWHLGETEDNDTGTRRPPSIHESSFAFNSSVLWDPERWGRPSSSQATSDQDSIKFVKEILEEGDAKVKGIPGDDCLKIMVWHLHQSRQESPLVTENTATMESNYNHLARRDK
ncbi:hypothetical protein MLD38_016182 [Melastoma candidum]|uniref:Uncharacterized protein n=1 Tax=Melastoma candidum TaxID=119954 RepID=A0ACB9RIM8_9MYRT|nr:hypothetical protein MLD38_016182 [Melastoma candidum]